MLKNKPSKVAGHTFDLEVKRLENPAATVGLFLVVAVLYQWLLQTDLQPNLHTKRHRA